LKQFNFFASNTNIIIRRTPLVGIVGAIDILNNAKNITAEQLKLIQVSRSCATNLLGIINDVLDFSKVTYLIQQFTT